jgi:hypothetical protein
METVYQAKELSMAWCISCHRNPGPHLRPKEHVTHLDWDWDTSEVEGKDQETWAKDHMLETNINPLVNCAVCHR